MQTHTCTPTHAHTHVQTHAHTYTHTHTPTYAQTHSTHTLPLEPPNQEQQDTHPDPQPSARLLRVLWWNSQMSACHSIHHIKWLNERYLRIILKGLLCKTLRHVLHAEILKKAARHSIHYIKWLNIRHLRIILKGLLCNTLRNVYCVEILKRQLATKFSIESDCTTDVWEFFWRGCCARRCAMYFTQKFSKGSSPLN